MSISAGTFGIGYDSDGNVLDYATITLFLADMAATLTGNLTGECDYGDNAQSLTFNEAVTFPALDTTVDYTFKLEGLHGSIADSSGQCSIDGGGVNWAFYLPQSSGVGNLHFKNLNFTNTTYGCVFDRAAAIGQLFEQISGIGNFNYSPFYTGSGVAYLLIKDCVFINTGAGRAVYLYCGGNVINTLMVSSEGTALDLPWNRTSRIQSSTVYGGAYGMTSPYNGCEFYQNVYIDSIIVGGTAAINTSTAQLVDLNYSRGMCNLCFWSAANPTKIAEKSGTSLTLAEYVPLYHASLRNVFLGDPDFANAGGTTLADYVLGESSACNKFGQSLVSNPLYSGKYFNRIDLGAWSNGISEDNVDQAVGGNLYLCPANRARKGYQYGVGGTGTTGEDESTDPGVANVNLFRRVCRYGCECRPTIGSRPGWHYIHYPFGRI